MDSSLPTLRFGDVDLDIVDNNGQPWLRLPQIEGALGYAHAGKALATLYDRNATEFTESMTALVKLPTAGGMQEVRIFSLRGAHLLAMFARTERAAEFRRWVLDILDQQCAASTESLAPPVEVNTVLKTLRRVIAERDTLRDLLAKRMLDEDPKLRKVLYYFNVQGLTNSERARLMGWKTVTTYTDALKKLAALGLVDWQPHPKLSQVGRSSIAKINPLVGQGRKSQPRLTAPGRLRPGNGRNAEEMDAARAVRDTKAAARKAGAA